MDWSHAAKPAACGVEFVAANSEAEKQGIRVGDKVTSFEGIRMNEVVCRYATDTCLCVA